MTVEQLYRTIDALYPRTLSCPWDNDGRMVVPDGNKPVKKVLVTLDADNEAVKAAIVSGADLILSHHPMIFHPLAALDCADPVARKAALLYANGISVLSFHTRFDCGEGGVNDALADLLGLLQTEKVTLEGLPLGRIGKLKEELSGSEFAALVKERLGCVFLRAVNTEKRVKTVALVGGSGGEFYKDVIGCGADAYLTGEASHHEMLDAQEAGLCLVCAGHDYTERPAVRALGALVKKADNGIEVVYNEKIVIPTL